MLKLVFKNLCIVFVLLGLGIPSLVHAGKSSDNSQESPELKGVKANSGTPKKEGETASRGNDEKVETDTKSLKDEELTEDEQPLETAESGGEEEYPEDEVFEESNEFEEDFKPIRDPLSGLNKFVFGVNKVVDIMFIKPITLLYKNITPSFVRTGVNNVLFNLKEPVHFANALLQFEGKKAGASFVRFLLNTVFGLGGLFDVAADAGIPREETDFGLTLAKWGFGEGFYLVLPIFGPSNLRDAVGRVGDFFLDPFNYYVYFCDKEHLGYIRAGATLLDTRLRLLDITDSLDKSDDPYTSYKVTFTDNRRYLVDKFEEVEGPRSVEEELYEDNVE